MRAMYVDIEPVSVEGWGGVSFCLDKIAEV